MLPISSHKFMNLTQEVQFILQGGSRKDLKLRKGKYSKKVMKFLVDNQIPY